MKIKFNRALEEATQHGLLSALRASAYLIISKISSRMIFSPLIFGKHFFIRGNNAKLGVGGLIYSRREKFEIELQKYFSAFHSGAFWDIGANYGYWSRYVSTISAQKNENTHIFAVEPMKANFEILSKNLSTEISEGKATLYQFALSDRTGISKIVEANSDPGSTHITTQEMSGVPIPTETLDVLYKNSGKIPIGLIKIDVEGYELRVLKGAKNTLRMEKPRIICEVIDRYLRRADSTPEDLFSFMNDLEFRGRKILEDGKLCKEDGFCGDGNYLFEHIRNGPRI